MTTALSPPETDIEILVARKLCSPGTRIFRCLKCRSLNSASPFELSSRGIACHHCHHFMCSNSISGQPCDMCDKVNALQQRRRVAQKGTEKA